MFKRGWSIEPPDPAYASGPTQTGHTIVLPNLTPEVAHALCQQQGTFSDDQKGYGVACYIPSLDAIAVPAKWPSDDERQQMLAHEFGHARGERHNADGTGVDWATSLPPVGWTDQLAGIPNARGTEPQNPAPVYASPAPPQAAALAWQNALGPRPAIPTALGLSPPTGQAATPPVPQGVFGFSARQTPGS